MSGRSVYKAFLELLGVAEQDGSHPPSNREAALREALLRDGALANWPAAQAALDRYTRPSPTPLVEPDPQTPAPPRPSPPLFITRETVSTHLTPFKEPPEAVLVTTHLARIGMRG